MDMAVMVASPVLPIGIGGPRRGLRSFDFASALVAAGQQGFVAPM